MEKWGFLCGQRYLIFDRDSKFCSSFRRLIRLAGIKTITLPPMSPNLNAFVAHYHEERNHQGKDNLLLFPSAEPSSLPGGGAIECKQRLGGMLKYYYRKAA